MVFEMKWPGVVGIGVAVLAVGGIGWALGSGVLGAKAPEGPKERVVSVPAGLEVPLLVLETIDAGGTPEGEEVQLIVSEDVFHDGEVVIAKGTRLSGEVSQSRGASLMSAMANRPARLAMTLPSVPVLGGDSVAVLAMDEDGEDAVWTFTQKNTAERVDATKIDALWSDEGSREALAAIADRMMKGKDLDGVEKELMAVAEALELDKTSEVVLRQQGDRSGLTMGKAVDAMVEGNLGRLAGADAVLAAEALGEVMDLVSSVDHKVRGIFKARTVRATVGTPVRVKTAEGFEVRVLEGGG